MFLQENGCKWKSLCLTNLVGFIVFSHLLILYFIKMHKILWICDMKIEAKLSGWMKRCKGNGRGRKREGRRGHDKMSSWHEELCAMNMCTERFPKGKNKNNIVFVSVFLQKLLFISHVHCQWGDFSEHGHLQCDVIENPVMQTP